MDFIFLAGTFIRHLSGSQFWNNQAGHLYTGDLRKAVEKPERICPAHRPGKSRRLEVSRDAGTDGTVQPERPVTYTGFATIIQRTRPTGFTQQPVSLCAIGRKHLFQLQEIVRIERWKVRYGQHISEWLETVGELDTLCSLGTFAYNHPQYTYPELTEKPFCFLATQMGHPLMPASQCVKNDATIPSRPFFLIITGANMAGKSTYLRTIGVNYLLACVGTPVCCEKLKLHPNQLITSLRTSDSLSDNESYFFAELKRLKRIIDLLNQGKQLFIILDEILKGTNSMDKQKGSFDLIRQFMQLKANGIIATHDLLLGSLIKQFPEEIRNYCFEADIKENELTFSYKLREGVAQNMNACFLMKKWKLFYKNKDTKTAF